MPMSPVLAASDGGKVLFWITPDMLQPIMDTLVGNIHQILPFCISIFALILIVGIVPDVLRSIFGRV